MLNHAKSQRLIAENGPFQAYEPLQTLSINLQSIDFEQTTVA